MQEVLLAWVGAADLKAPEELETSGMGPIAQALTALTFDTAYLLSNYAVERLPPYVEWLRPQTRAHVEVVPVSMTSPTHFGEIYQAAAHAASQFADAPRGPARLTYHLSPGTPAMAAVWMLLGKTRFPGQFIESSREHGVRVAHIPFDIAADFIPDLLADRDARLRDQAAAPTTAAPEFSDIVHRSRAMTRLVAKARHVAVHDIPVILEGESGTGKELFARAIHRTSRRAAKPFIAVNCGAISPALIESELFGHDKGAFTGAHQAHEGYFEAAHGGTLFLDELGELTPAAQVKLLRVLQEGEVVRVGGTKPIKVSVRVIAATHKDLIDEVEAGRFREDLFFRLAVALLKLPPLRERGSDVTLLADHILARVNEAGASDPGYQHKKLSAAARNLVQTHPWPGNVRELDNTLQRAAIWTDGATISGEDMREALLPLRAPKGDVLSRPLGDGFDVNVLVSEVAQHYLQRAMSEANGVKARAASLLGLASATTLSNWLKKHGID